MLTFGLKLGCGRGIHGAGNTRSPPGHTAKGATPQDDPGWPEFCTGDHPGPNSVQDTRGLDRPQVAAALDVSERTVFRTKRRYAAEVLRHHNQANQ